MKNIITFIDLFAGMGGIRAGFEQACSELGVTSQCVFTSEIKSHAIQVLQDNHPQETIHGDITQIDAQQIPDFDYLLAGFRCQAFSYAGKRRGFADVRGTLFFEVERIIKEKQPLGFILENVEGLVTHNKENPTDKIGRTLTTILDRLQDLGYKTAWKVLNSKDFGLAQERKRIYIVGTKTTTPSLDFDVPMVSRTFGDIMEHHQPTKQSTFISQLLKKFTPQDLYGKSIKDKRGGKNNIHSWDIETKGPISQSQKQLLNKILTARRKKQWAKEFGIKWMDGMPLTLQQIQTFAAHENLQAELDDLVAKGYLTLEHPKQLVNGKRVQDPNLPLGYNIVTGKLSFEINKILDPHQVVPTLVAMDMKGTFVVDNGGLRNLTLKEGLRLFGYPDNYKFNVTQQQGFDLLGNTVVVPVIKQVAKKLLKA